MNSETFELVRASRALGISATYVSQAEEAAKSFENKVKHLIQQVINCKQWKKEQSSHCCTADIADVCSLTSWTDTLGHILVVV